MLVETTASTRYIHLQELVDFDRKESWEISDIGESYHDLKFKKNLKMLKLRLSFNASFNKWLTFLVKSEIFDV